MSKKKNNMHYIDNKLFLSEMIKYKEECAQCETEGKETPILPEYIGECFIKIAERLSYRPNFINYSFRDEMVSDGIENCIQYAYNFNPEKSSNPFSYFTQIIYYAFIRRIQKEKKQLYIKYKTIQERPLLSQNIEISEYDNNSSEFDIETITEEQKINMYGFVDNFEKSKKKKTEKKTKNSLASFIQE